LGGFADRFHLIAGCKEAGAARPWIDIPDEPDTSGKILVELQLHFLRRVAFREDFDSGPLSVHPQFFGMLGKRKRDI
jgi:hypothetical protein